jgi:hypothetical protein
MNILGSSINYDTWINMNGDSGASFVDRNILSVYPCIPRLHDAGMQMMECVTESYESYRI